MRTALAVAVAALFLVSAVQGALNTDRTLPTSGSVCIDKFNALVKKEYASDKACADLVKAALSTSDTSKCPAGSRDKSSGVQKCMAKAPAAWVDFVKNCEVMNVANRAGEAEAASSRKPSCMPDFASVQDFASYVNGGSGGSASTAAAASGAAAAAPALLAAAAAAAVALAF